VAETSNLSDNRVPGSGRRATIADVALHAGVSQTTVSHVLSGHRPVATKTQDKVRTSVELLNFRPNDIARALRNQRTHNVALVVPNIAHVTYPIVARGITTTLRPLGYQVAMYDTDDKPDTEANVVRALAERVVDGAIFFGFSLSERNAEILFNANIPFVNGGMNSEAHSLWDTVSLDQRQGIEATTRLALQQSSGPIGYLGGPLGSGTAEVREAGFRAAMQKAGREIDERLIARVPYEWVAGREAIRTMALQTELPHAIVCANDLIAIGAMSQARQEGLSVPNDITFSGFDNIEACEFVVPGLTSVETHLAEQGRACARLLLDRMSRSYTGPARHISLRTEVVCRQSTGSTGN